MKQLFIIFFTLLFGLSSALAQEAEPGEEQEFNGVLMEQTLLETAEIEQGSRSLIVDNTRSKIGRDFFDLFYQRWTSMPSDTSQAGRRAAELDPTEYLITIDELPTIGIGTLLNVSINDQLVWQAILQARYELIEENAFGASDYIFQYVLYYQDIQNQLGTADQVGTGIY